MQYLLEVLGSTFIGAFFIYTVLNFNIKMSDTFNDSIMSNKTLFDTIELGKLLDYDFNKIGYRVASDTIFYVTLKDEVHYFSDVDNDGDVDSVTYVLGSKDDALATINPYDKAFYRIINSTDTTTYYVNSFEIAYLDSNYVEITPVSSLNSNIQRTRVKGIILRYSVGSDHKIGSNYQAEGEYEYVECQKKIIPLNI